MIFRKIKKEFDRNRNKLFRSNEEHQQPLKEQYTQYNLPYENGDKEVKTPIIKSIDETIEKILKDECSISRFGDGEFSVMTGSRIHFQNANPKMAKRIKEVLSSNEPNLLIALPDCFDSLNHFSQEVIDWYRKWSFKKRQKIYSYLDMDREFYNAYLTRVYMPFKKSADNYEKCQKYFEEIKKIWLGKDVVICEGEGTRFGMFNDLLDGAKSISRIICPARSAFDKYDEILSAFNDISPDKLVLAALGPTAIVLAYDLCNEGYQAIDIGHLDLEYKWFLRKDVVGTPLEFKYVNGSSKGIKVHRRKTLNTKDKS